MTKSKLKQFKGATGFKWNFYEGTYQEFLKETGLDQVHGYYKGDFDDFLEMIGADDVSYEGFSDEQLLAVYEYWQEHIDEPEMLIVKRAFEDNLEDVIDSDINDVIDNFELVLDKAAEILKSME